MSDSPITDEAILRLQHGGADELADQFKAAESGLRKMVSLRLNALRRRVDAMDVVQETFVEASRRLEEYVANPVVTPVVWFRQLARQVLSRQFRSHFGAKARDLGREVGLDALQSADSESMAIDLSESMASPHSVAAMEEERLELQRLLTQMQPLDKEVLCLKQIEGLSFTEISAELDLSTSAAKRAYHRAITQLRTMSSFLSRQSVS